METRYKRQSEGGVRERVVFSKEQRRTIMLYHFRSGYSAKQSFEELQNRLGSEGPNLSNVHKWFQRFQTGNFQVSDDPRSGRPRTSTDDQNVAAVKQAIDEEPQINIKRLVEMFGIPKNINCEHPP